MNETQKIPLKRLFLEATAIVASILFAFAIDAWWDDMRSADDERIFLQSLLEDLENKKLLLANDRVYNGAILESVTWLLRSANDPSLELSEETIDRRISDTWWYNTESSWDSAPMRALAGGNPSIISNPSLLQKLAELQVSISRIRNFYKIDENFHHDVYTPFLISKANLTQITGTTEHFPGQPEKSYKYPHIEVSAIQVHSQLIRQKEFQNMLTAKMDRVLDILQNAYRLIDGELEEVIVLLRKELAALS